MKKTWIAVGMAALFLAVGAVLSAKADGTGCPMAKGKKDKGACCAMGMKDIKNCKFTYKAMGKDDKPCYVCPMRDSMSDKPGKCPKCGMTLEKKFCPSMGDMKMGGKKCPFMSGKAAKDAPKGDWTSKGDTDRSIKP